MAGPGDYYGSYGQAASSIAKGVDDVWSLFRGKTDNQNNTRTVDMSTTESEEVSPEKAKALLDQLLSGTNGLAQLVSGQKAAGVYDSTTNLQLTNDLLARSTASIASLSSKKTTEQSGTVNDASSQHKKGAFEWIVCTELHKQHRIPHDFYRKGAKKFATYGEDVKRGYYYWAVAAVKHLRTKPNSKLSNFLAYVFLNRAEYVASQMGCKRAKKTVTGFLATYVTYAICWSLCKTVARKQVDWYSKVYPEGV